jgi:hypothetical protein
MLDALAARNVRTVDLRPALRAARTTGPVYYQHDTHWAPRGAVIGFNLVAATAGHPTLQLAPASVLAPTERNGGDLARVLGIARHVVEHTEEMNLPAQPPGPPTILIVGDSFTLAFPAMLAANGVRATWTHHEWCGFDWKRIEEVKPDEVWWMPTERYLLCRPGVHPKGIPSPHRAE